MPVGDAFFCAVEGKPRGVAPCPHQRLCLWTPRRVFDPLDTHFAIELSALSGYARVLIFIYAAIMSAVAIALSGYARVLIRPLSRRSGQRGLAAIKVNKHGCAPEGVKGGDRKAPLSRPQARNPLHMRKSSYGHKPNCTVASI